MNDCTQSIYIVRQYDYTNVEDVLYAAHSSDDLTNIYYPRARYQLASTYKPTRRVGACHQSLYYVCDPCIASKKSDRLGVLEACDNRHASSSKNDHHFCTTNSRANHSVYARADSYSVPRIRCRIDRDTAIYRCRFPNSTNICDNGHQSHREPD
jgi:hypothetical protein